MVGDRAAYDGAAAEVGCPVLLLPPLSQVEDRRLGLVTAIVRGASTGSQTPRSSPPR